MGAPQYEQAGADIGGSGTTNTIPRWTGASTLGDSGLIDDGTQVYTTTRRVGLGTATPNAATRLHVVGTTWITGGNLLVDTVLPFTGGTTPLNVANLIYARVDTNNVGIGTASPASYISASSTVLAVASPGGNLGTVRVSNTSSFASGNQAEFFASTTAVGLWGSTNCPMLFYTNSTERARIDSNGNIYGTSGTTGMTNGFFYIPAAAGAPTGTPTAVSGRVPMYYDTTNNQFYVYNGAWKKVTLA